jgi:transposase
VDRLTPPTIEELRAIDADGRDAMCDLVLQLFVEHNDLIDRLAASDARNLALQHKVDELTARLNKDSHNSSKPPSTDGFKKKPVTLRMKSGNKPGGQKGHPGSGLAFCDAPKDPIIHSPSSCCKCGANLDQATSVLREKRQVFDIPPPIELECIEHQSHVKCCPCCGEETAAPFPAGVDSTVQYGPRFNAAMLYWTTYQMVPTGRVREMAADLFGVCISEGTLYNIINRASETLSPLETRIMDALAKDTTTCHDETGARVNGSLHWIHVICNKAFTVFRRNKRRGKVAMDAMGILGRLTGTAVHDGWKPYFQFLCKHGLCNAHHLRELKALFEQHGQKWAADMIKVLLDAKAAVEKSILQGRNCVQPRILRRLENRYSATIAAGHKANPLPEATGKRGRPKRSVGGNLVRRLEDYREATLAFLYDFEVPFDNNQAERDIRMIKVKLKVSSCFRSEAGADAFCRLRGYISTMRKQGHNVLDALYSVCKGTPTCPYLGVE